MQGANQSAAVESGDGQTDGAIDLAVDAGDPVDAPICEPEPEPELTDEEKLLLCIQWIERRIDLSKTLKQALSEESRAVIAAFFSEPVDSALYAYMDKDTCSVLVRNIPPVMSDTPVQYFFKDSDAPLWNNAQGAGVPEVQLLPQSIFFGYLRTANLVEDLTSLVGQLCLPEVRKNKTWPASLSKDLVSSLERFMGNMTDMQNLADGKTILYVPNDDLSLPGACAKDKDLCQRLEASVIHWTRQIKGLINGGTQGKQLEESPLGELELWRSRSSDLSGLEAQLKAPGVMRVVQVKKKKCWAWQSLVYLEPFD